MKNFLLRCISFSTLPVFLAVLIYFFNSRSIDVNGYSTSKSVIFVGDSHTAAAINPQFYPNSVNIASTGEPYLITYQKLSYVLNTSEKIDTVYLGFSYHNISKSIDYKFEENDWAKKQLGSSYMYSSISDFRNTNINREVLYSVFMKNFLLVPKISHFKDFGEGYMKREANLTEANIESKIKRQFFHKDSLSGISFQNIKYLEKIIEMCNERDKVLILIGTPLTKEYQRRIPDIYIEEYELLSKRLIDLFQIKISNNFELDNQTEEWFYDHNHLSHVGADYYTSLLKNTFVK